MISSNELNQFKKDFYAENLPALKRMIIKNPALMNADFSDDGIFIERPLQILRNGMPKGDGQALFSPEFSKQYTSFAIDMGFDPDTEFSPNIGSYVEFAWRAKNVEAGSQIILGKVEKEWKQSGTIYQPNLDAVMCTLMESDDPEFNLMFRGGAIEEIGRVHEAIRAALLNPQTEREKLVADFLGPQSYFTSPFPFKPEDHANFAKAPAEQRAALERMLAVDLDSEDAEDLLERMLSGDTSTKPTEFAARILLNTGRQAEAIQAENLAAVRADPPKQKPRLGENNQG